MTNDRVPTGPFTISAEFILYHNHRLDPASKGRYAMRLPDRSLVWLEEYEQRLRQYELKAEPDRKA